MLITEVDRRTLDVMPTQMIDVPAGLNGVIAADTAIGDVHGDEGFFHYGPYDAAELARTRTFEEVWYLIRAGRLPDEAELTAFRAEVASHRSVPAGLLDLLRQQTIGIHCHKNFRCLHTDFEILIIKFVEDIDMAQR